jgi:hypothetical protein
MCPFCPRGCSVVARAHGPSNRSLVKNGPSGAWRGGIRPGFGPPRPADATPGSLDQWSRPSAPAPGACPESPIPMPSRSVRPAGKRHSHGGYFAGADAPCTPVTCQGCAGQRQGASRWRCRPPSALEAVNPLGTLTCPASWGDDGHSRAGCPGRRDCRRRERSRPHGGCVRPGRPTARRRWPRVTGVTLARSVRGHSFRAAACCCRRRHGTAPDNWSGGETWRSVTRTS